MRPAEHNGMQKYSVLLHSPAQDLQALETEAQFAAVRFERLGFQAFATNLEYKLILLRGVYLFFVVRLDLQNNVYVNFRNTYYMSGRWWVWGT